MKPTLSTKTAARFGVSRQSLYLRRLRILGDGISMSCWCLPALRVAVDSGADAVYMGFKDDTNARHFAGLNFNDRKARQALDYAIDRKVKVFVAIKLTRNPRLEAMAGSSGSRL